MNVPQEVLVALCGLTLGALVFLALRRERALHPSVNTAHPFAGLAELVRGCGALALWAIGSLVLGAVLITVVGWAYRVVFG